MRLRVQRATELPRLLSSYLGRRRLWNDATLRLWPAAAPLLAAYRRTVLRRTPVVAVVGSQGKSTTVRAIFAALDLRPHRFLDFNAGLEIGLNVLKARRRDTAAVVEVGIGAPGQMQSYAATLRPDLVVVTSIGTEHGSSLGDALGIRTEKSHMVAAVPATGTVFLNADDAHVLWMRERTRARSVTFGLGADADVRATDVRLDWPRGTRFTLCVRGQKRQTRVRFVSPELVRAALAAVAVSLELGEPLARVVERLEQLPPTPMRLEPVQLDNGAWLLRDEYKSALETVHAALDVMQAVPAPARRFVVMGEVSEPPGSQGPIYRHIGERLAGFADGGIFVGGNFQRYAAGARRAGMARERLVDAGRSWQVAERYLRDTLQPGDVVLVKGRDTQRLERLSLSLLGHPVRCDRTECELPGCERCPLLTRPAQ